VSEDQEQALKQLSDKLSSVIFDWSEYWRTYSGFDNWQVWVVLLVLIAPLVVLVLTLDRNKAFRLGFYGFAIHIIAIYFDLYATHHKMWEYPFKITPFPPVSFGLDTSLIPVSYMLVYQWTLNHRKNYYFYLLVLSIVFAFLIKPLLSSLDLFWLYQSNYFHLLIMYFGGGVIGKWVTDLFQWAESKAKA
jgi:hypothetical protein